MRTPRMGIGLGVAIMAMAAATIGRAEPAARDGAVEAASAWLALVDNGQYGESWEQAASFFRSAVTKPQWEQTIGGVRPPLGQVSSRVVSSAEYTKSLPGAPDGRYVVIQFTTAFEHKASSVETVTPMQQPDGTWRVAGYYIK